jgi:hypothetical protein
MPAFRNLIALVSANVVTGLAAAGYPALVDGAILIGGQHVYEHSSAPRIVFVPAASTFGVRDPASPSRVSGADIAEQQAQWLQHPIASEMITFEVHCWGAATTGNPDDDYDVTQALYQQILMSLHLLCEGCYRILPGKWTSGTAQGTQLGKLGQEFVFGVEFSTPVLGELLAFAPGIAVKGIINATDAAGVPIEITTSTAHGLTTGNTVTIASVGGQTLANGTWTATVGSNPAKFTIAQNGDGAHPYTIGGTCTIAPVAGTVGVTLTDNAGTTIAHVDVTT